MFYYFRSVAAVQNDTQGGAKNTCYEDFTKYLHDLTSDDPPLYALNSKCCNNMFVS